MEREPSWNSEFFRKYTEKILSLRQHADVSDLNKPRFIGTDNYKFKNKVYRRLRIILRSNGCSVPTCTMCPFPNESVSENAYRVSDQNYIAQVKLALSKHPNYEVVSIYNDGSFFAPKELSGSARNEIYYLLKEYGCKILMVESIPNFITEEVLNPAYSILGESIKLVVGIGLESADAVVRDICIRTVVTEEAFLNANILLNKFGYYLKAYLLIKPPFFLEEETVGDVINSTGWLFDKNISDITLCPMRVAAGTVINDLFQKRLYSPPMLTTIAEIMHQVNQKNIPVRVSIFNVDSSDIKSTTPYGCPECQNKILNALNAHNNMEIVDFSKLTCQHCQEQGKRNDPAEFKGLSFEERVLFWMNY